MDIGGRMSPCFQGPGPQDLTWPPCLCGAREEKGVVTYPASSLHPFCGVFSLRCCQLGSHHRSSSKGLAGRWNKKGLPAQGSCISSFWPRPLLGDSVINPQVL